MNNIDQSPSTRLIESPLAETLVAAKLQGGADQLAEGAATGLDALVEALISWTQSAVGSHEIITACELFFTQYGKVFHDDTFYDNRMAYFFDHFLFERALSKSFLEKTSLKKLEIWTPYKVFLHHLGGQQGQNVDDSVRQGFHQLQGFRHSLYQVRKLRGSHMVVRDLIQQDTLRLEDEAGYAFVGFDKGDIFQSFVFPATNHYCLSQGVILHPYQAGRIIRRYLRQALKEEAFPRHRALSRLARQHIRHVRHRHVDAKLIYQQEPR